MELSKQVISLSLAKRLKELGVKQNSHFWWVSFESPREEEILCVNDVVNNAYDPECSAFTVVELVNILQTVAEEDIIIALQDNNVAETLGETLCTKLQSSKENAGSGRTQ